MISDASVDRFYYIFDSREQRALVLDRTTGKEVAWASVPRVQLIDYVGRQQGTLTLRQFARWCALQTDVAAVPDDTVAGRLWAAVDAGELARRSVRAEATDAAVRAAALGLPKGESAAAQLLAVHACTHPDPFRAAVDAAHMGERWAEFEAEREPRRAVRLMRQRHVDWLLDAL